MSMENAEKLVNRLRSERELQEKFENALRSAFPEEKYGCTYEELKEFIVMKRHLDADELATVTGGTAFTCNVDWQSDRHGGCTQNYYKQKCTATVEDGSWCWSNDKCIAFDCVYSVKK